MLRRLLAPVLLAAPALLAPASLVEEARAAQVSGEYTRAAAPAGRAIMEGGPDAAAEAIRAESLNALALERASAGAWDEALAALDGALEALPDHPAIRRNRDRVAINAAVHRAQSGEDFEEAIALVTGVEASGDVATRQIQAASLIELLWARHLEARGEDEAQRVHLERAISWEPDNVAALVDLAEWHQARAEADAAYPLLERAHGIDPALPEVIRALRQIERDREATASHERLTTDHFTLLFPRGAREFGETCLQVLEQERMRLAGLFGHTPSRRIPLTIHTAEQFQEVTLAPHWALASYDGQIRVAVRPIETREQRRALQDTLSHELTHAFIFDLAHAAAPAWLNEGLAQNFETHFRIAPRARADLRDCARSGELIPIPDLPADFSQIPSTRQAQIAYLSSASFVEGLLQRFGAAALRGVLTDLRRGETIDSAIRRNLRTTLAGLDRAWRDSL